MSIEYNPFATRCTRPGSLAYEFPRDHGESLTRCLDRLASSGWWGQIVGPHGTGKSTLLQSLAPRLEEAGRILVWQRLTAGQRTLRWEHDAAAWGSSTQVIVDGYEQLGWWSRWSLKRRCQLRGAGLLITTHRPQGFPTIYETRSSPELLAALVARLLPTEPNRFSLPLLTEIWNRHRGNIREALFELYDRYE